LFRLGDVGERLGFRRGGGPEGRELMMVHTRLKRSTREGENELWRAGNRGYLISGQKYRNIFAICDRISGLAKNWPRFYWQGV
jgi:hypothetical protein